MKKFKVTFLPANKTVEVPEDTNILSAAILADLHINSTCGGDGVCGRCKVKLITGKVITQPTGSISMGEISRKIYLACMTTIHSDVEVEIIPESMLDLEKPGTQGMDLKLQEIYTSAEDIEISMLAPKAEVFKHSPLATKIYLELPRPNLEDRASDLERLYSQLEKLGIRVLQTGLANIRQLGELLRDSDWKVTVTLGKRDGATEIVLIEPGDTSRKNLGVCFDIGTTTISGQLVDLKNKKVLGTKAAYNKQATFGSDVITRILYARKEEGLERLHQAVCDSMNQIIQELIHERKAGLGDVTCILCSGNTTMIHLLLRIDPTYIRKEPYVPTANFLPTVRAAEAGIQINPRGLLYCVPGVASYVGGDVTAGTLSCGLYKTTELSLLIDIGTNGEVVLGSKEFLVACAASAGPAFEGSGVSCGMRASRGAIQKVSIGPRGLEVKYSTIGDEKPKGICGSGYIDIIAGLLRLGLIDKSGKIKDAGSPRIRQGETGNEFVIAPKEECDCGSDIVITDADIENLKRAKAAIYSASAVLLRHMGFELKQVKKIFIAGGFGTYLDMANAITIGLLPDLDKSRFLFVGNSSLAGSRMILLSDEAMKKVDDIARKITYFELSVDAHYMDEYMAALFFPHTDLNRFPSVRWAA